MSNFRKEASSSVLDVWKESLQNKNYRQGVGLIIKITNRFLFAVGKESFWQQNNYGLTITYTAVGGTRELKESFSDCAHREAKEELGVDVEIFKPKKSTFYDFRTKIKKDLILEESSIPWFVYTMPLVGKDGLSVCVYLARLKTTPPRPSMEIPALILLTPQQIADNKLKPLSVLLTEGAEIIEQRKVPRNAIMKPFGTAEILQTFSLQELGNI